MSGELPVVADAGRTETARLDDEDYWRRRILGDGYYEPRSEAEERQFVALDDLFAAYRAAALRLERAEQEQREADVEPVKFRIGPAGFFAVYVEQRPQRDGTVLWAVTQGGNVLAKDGDWEYEPQPSSRDEAFTLRCRWPSMREAVAAYRLAASPAPTAEPDHG